MSHVGGGANRPARVRFGDIWIDALDFGQAVAAIEQLVDRGAGGAVYTPNVDHVVVARRNPTFRQAYQRADLVLCDGQPIVWTSGLLGLALPERVSGSDVFLPLMHLAARRGYRVYLLGGGEGVAPDAAERLRREIGVEVVGFSSPRIGQEALPDEEAVVETVRATRPHIVLACLGTPKGELWIARTRDRLGPAVSLSIGATLDFYTGRVRRAPRWMQRLGLEWLYRLLQEPRRLARRYLVDDPAFLGILLETWRAPRHQRVLAPGDPAPGTSPDPGT